MSGQNQFARLLADRGLTLQRGSVETLQINLGLLCNQACRHCHLEAGPDRTERMSRETMDQVVEYARAGRFAVIDLTGGAPELNPDLPYLLEQLRGIAPRLMLRANLTALMARREALMPLLREGRVVIFGSLPTLDVAQTDQQRGARTFDRSLECLSFLNGQGWGRDGTGLELNLISNPVEPVLAPDQDQTEARFRRLLLDRYGITFDHLFCFANMPLGRFRTRLEESGDLEPYQQRLIEAFNPCALQGVMCRTLVSVDWAGYLYDCDFHQAAGIPLGSERTHVSQLSAPPAEGSSIAVADHCLTCTAGAGFT